MTAEDYIQQLQLTPHPEGGYFKQIYGNDETGEKSISTIYYMLAGEDISAFHRLREMVEIWYYQAGANLKLHVIDVDGTLTTHLLSPEGEMQVVIQPEQWFAAEVASRKGFTLVGCAVGPAFQFDKFELADKAQLLESYPQHRELIERMCR